MRQPPHKTGSALPLSAYPAAFLAVFLFFSVDVRAQGPAPEEILASVCSLALTQSMPLTDDPADSAAAALTVQDTAVQIRTDTRNGCGSILSIDTGILRLITAAHVVEGADEGSAIFSEGFAAPFRVETRDELRDIALLSVQSGKLPAAVLLRLHSIVPEMSAGEIEETPSPTVGDEVFCLQGDDVHAGVIVSLDAIAVTPPGTAWIGAPRVTAHAGSSAGNTPSRICCLLDASPGMSGGGVFDARGYYIGMILGYEEDDSSFVLVAPAESVRSLRKPV